MSGLNTNTYFYFPLNSWDKAIEYRAGFLPNYAEFNGTSSYVQYPDSTDWDFVGNNTDSWTIDCWVQINSLTDARIFSQSDLSNEAMELVHNTNVMTFQVYISGFQIQCNANSEYIKDNLWHHIAVVIIGQGSSKDIAIYKDGIQIGWVQSSYTYTLDDPFTIGNNGSTKSIDGNISEFSVYKGNRFGVTPNSGLTSSFEVPTLPYQSDANTKLLVHMQGNSLDYGNTGHTATDTSMTYSGSDNVSPIADSLHYAKFYGGVESYMSYADSTDWDIVGSSSDDWTINLWVRHGAITSDTEPYISQIESSNAWWMLYRRGDNLINFQVRVSSVNQVYLLSTSAIADTNWHNICVAKVGNIFGLFIDGVQEAYHQVTYTRTFAGTLDFGLYNLAPKYFYGSMAQFQLQKSNFYSASPVVGLTDTIQIPFYKHTADVNTKLLLQFDQDFTDESPSAHTPTYRGAITLHDKTPWRSNSVARYDDMNAQATGTYNRVSFGGNYDVVALNPSTDYDIFASYLTDITLEFFIKLQNYSGERFIVGMYNLALSKSWRIAFQGDGSPNGYGLITVNMGGIGLAKGGTTTINTWHHVCLVRKGGASNGEYAIYVDGVQVSYQQTSATDTLDGYLRISQDSQVLFENFHLTYLNKYNVAPNVGITDSFTSPTLAIPQDEGTVMMVQPDDRDSIAYRYGGGAPNYLLNFPTGSPPNGTIFTSDDNVFGNGCFQVDGTGNCTTNGVSWEYWMQDNVSTWVQDWWFKLDSTSTTAWMFGQDDLAGNIMVIRHLATGDGIELVLTGFITFTCSMVGNGWVDDTNWHHYAIAILGNGSLKEVAIYVDGKQYAYGTTSATGSINSPIYVMGRGADIISGKLDSWRNQESNYFNLTPVVGLTDTYEVPYLPYTGAQWTPYTQSIVII